MRNLFHGVELSLHGQVEAFDDQEVGRVLAGQVGAAVKHEGLAVVILAQPSESFQVCKSQ